MKVAQLEAGLKESGEELATLKREREKDALTLGELQGLLAERSKELSTAKDSNADLELKLATLTQMLDGAREQEAALAEKVKADEALLASAAAAQNTFRENVERWTEGLVDVAAAIDRELALLGMEDFGYSSDEHLQPSAKTACSSRAWQRPSSDSGRRSQSSWPTSRARSARELSKRC